MALRQHDAVPHDRMGPQRERDRVHSDPLHSRSIESLDAQWS